MIECHLDQGRRRSGRWFVQIYDLGNKSLTECRSPSSQTSSRTLYGTPMRQGVILSIVEGSPRRSVSRRSDNCALCIWRSHWRFPFCEQQVQLYTDSYIRVYNTHLLTQSLSKIYQSINIYKSCSSVQLYTSCTKNLPFHPFLWTTWTTEQGFYIHMRIYALTLYSLSEILKF